MSEQQPLTATAAQASQQLRQLAHDVNTHLSVITMGMEALQATRDDADQFEQVRETIQQEGVAPLKEHLATLIKLASAGLE